MIRLRGTRALHAATKWLHRTPQAGSGAAQGPGQKPPQPPPRGSTPPHAASRVGAIDAAAGSAAAARSPQGSYTRGRRGLGGRAAADLVSIRVDEVSGVGTLFLDSITMPPAFFTGLKGAMEELQSDSRVRSVLIRAGEANKHFSYGLDLKEAAKGFAGIPMDGPRHEMRRVIAEWQEGFTAVAKSRKPVVAAVSGWCIGAGLELIAAADIRLCDRGARFVLKEAELGIVADLGGLQRLPGIIGAGPTRHLALLAEEVDAARALQLALVTGVEGDAPALYAEAGRVAARVARMDPHCMAGIKAVMEFQENKSVDEGLAFVAAHNAGMLDVAGIVQALAAIERKMKERK